MATPRRVTCVKRTHEKITHIGGPWGPYGECKIVTELEAIRLMNAGIYVYHVDVRGTDVKVIEAHDKGVPYLRTAPDASKIDNLAALPDCSPSCT
jgi:hypothetical protein